MFNWLRRRFEDRSNEAAAKTEQEAWLLAYKADLLKILRSGNLPSTTDFSIDGDLPFRFQKSEHLLWVFSSVEYLEQKTRREIVGRSAGASILVAQ